MYNFNEVDGCKEIKIEVRQTLLDVKLKMITDINRSFTLTSQIINEHDEFVLYYTYITDPNSVGIESNPIQYGTARIVIDDVTELKGRYWTTSKTIGDILLNAE